MAAFIVQCWKAQIIAAVRNNKEKLNVCCRRILFISTHDNLLVGPMNSIFTFGETLDPLGPPFTRKRVPSAVVSTLVARTQYERLLTYGCCRRRVKRD